MTIHDVFSEFFIFVLIFHLTNHVINLLYVPRQCRHVIHTWQCIQPLWSITGGTLWLICIWQCIQPLQPTTISMMAPSPAHSHLMMHTTSMTNHYLYSSTLSICIWQCIQPLWPTTISTMPSPNSFTSDDAYNLYDWPLSLQWHPLWLIHIWQCIQPLWPTTISTTPSPDSFTSDDAYNLYDWCRQENCVFWGATPHTA